MHRIARILLVGLLAGFVGEGVLGILFVSPVVKSVMYNPELQSQLFIDLTSSRNIPISVAGLVVLSSIHAWLFLVFAKSIPGATWWGKGLFWGVTIWLMYWVFQEWFIFRTLLKEPVLLSLFELLLLLLGSFVEGLVISFAFRKEVAGTNEA